METEPIYKNLKVLVIEDDFASHTLYAEYLKSLAGTVLISETGLDGINMYKENQDIDLILMDIRLPDLNGIEVSKRIREISKDVIIAAQTAYVYTDVNDSAMEAGCNEFLTKPLSKETLHNLLINYFD